MEENFYSNNNELNNDNNFQVKTEESVNNIQIEQTNSNKINIHALLGFIFTWIFIFSGGAFLIDNSDSIITSPDDGIIVFLIGVILLSAPVAMSGIVWSIINFSLSMTGLKKIKKSNERGKGLAIASLIMNGIIGVLSVITVVCFLIIVVQAIIGISQI